MSSFPVTRLRRLRRTAALRDLVRETRLDIADFVYPLFVAPEPLASADLPPMSRLTVDGAVREAEELTSLGVRAVLLFGIPEEKDEEASGAYDGDGIVQQALRALRGRFPELVLLTDVCLCEYTSHGHCGVVENGEVANDATLDLLARTAVSHAEAGADAVCPSDMMDGRVGAIRSELDDSNFESTPILAYSAKYASAFYGPFREAFDLPVAAYNVSGEYAMLKAAAARGWLDERQAVLESLTAIKRAGADMIISYWTKELARWL